MLGADVGSSLMVVVFSLDLSWVSPLLIFTGVVASISRDGSTAALVGRCVLGVGLMTLALHLMFPKSFVGSFARPVMPMSRSDTRQALHSGTLSNDSNLSVIGLGCQMVGRATTVEKLSRS
jgi:hypothetical protein